MENKSAILVLMFFFFISSIEAIKLNSMQGVSNGQWYQIKYAYGNFCLSIKNFPSVTSQDCDANDNDQKFRFDRENVNSDWYNLITKTGHFLDYDETDKQTFLVVKMQFSYNPRQLWAPRILNNKNYIIENQAKHWAVMWNYNGPYTKLLLTNIKDGLMDQHWILNQLTFPPQPQPQPQPQPKPQPQPSPSSGDKNNDIVPSEKSKCKRN